MTLKTKNMRAAIIGFGGMGQRHYKAYNLIGVDVCAICDWKKENIQKALPDFPIEHSYSDHKELLENEDVDIISVVTNGPTHAAITIDASNAGIKRILCEKPMGTSLQLAQDIIDVCNKNNTRLAVNHIKRYSLDYKKIKELIGSGIIGDLRHMYFSCGNTGLGNFAIHFFDIARYLTDSEPEWTIGFIDDTATPNPRGKEFADPGGYGIIRFKNGVRLFIDSSEDTGVQYSFQLVCTYGRIIIDELNSYWQIRARSEEDKSIPLTRYGTDMPLFPYECTEKYDIVTLTSRALKQLLSDEEISSPGINGKKSLEMVLSMHISAERDNAKVYFPIDVKYYNKEIKIA